ncbi:MAG: AMP-binding protein, partial [Candidatus Dormibacteria bacterium]
MSALAAQARNHPGRLALAIRRKAGRFGKRYEEVSADELERDANAFAAALAHHGIRNGMRTAVMIPPGREFCAAIFALLKLGAPPVLIDRGIGLRNVGHAIQRAVPAAFLGVRKADLARRIFGWGRDSIGISLTVESLSGRLLKQGSEVTEDRRATRSLDDLAAIAFTSGSTGRPKGVMFDHGNLCAQADLVQELLGPCAGGPH